MHKIFYKILGAFFGFMSFGAVLESYRIMTSSAPDIAPERSYLAIMSIAILGVLVSLTVFFWRKGNR